MATDYSLLSPKAAARLAEINRTISTKARNVRAYKSAHPLEAFSTTNPANGKLHTKQQEFLDLVREERKRVFVMLGANRTGKTCVGATLAWSLTQGRYLWVPKPAPVPLRVVDGITISPKYVDPGKLRFDPPTRGRIYAETWDAHRDVIIPELKRWMHPDLIAITKKNALGMEAQYILKNGSSFELRTYAQDSATEEGWKGHWVWCDEPPPRSTWLANWRGLTDYRGIFIFTLTPLKEPWIQDEIVDDPSPMNAIVTVDIRDNPFMSEQAILDFESKLTDDEKESRIHGKFFHLQGLVFKEWSEKNIVADFIPKSGWTCYAGVDTHPRTEQAIGFFAVDPRGNIFLVHESFKHGGPEDVADRIIDFHETIHKIDTVIIEPGSKIASPQGESMFSIIERRLGAKAINLELGSKDLESGILLMAEAIKSQNGISSLYVCKRCVRFLWEIKHYIWAGWKGRTADGRQERQRPQDKDDHFMELTRRMIQIPICYKDPNYMDDFKDNWHPQDDTAGY